MSSRTRSVAVAVSAMIGTSGKCLRSFASWRYSGRKSWPHSLMQCASSIAICATFQFSARSEKSIEHQPLRRDVEQPEFAVMQSAQRARALPRRSSEEFRNVAATPLACSAST